MRNWYVPGRDLASLNPQEYTPLSVSEGDEDETQMRSLKHTRIGAHRKVHAGYGIADIWSESEDSG